jgi:hypothetical protein
MLDGGTTFVMRHEHRRIAEQLRVMDRNVLEDNADDAEPEPALLAMFAAHNLKEECVLYPAVDQVTRLEERGDLLRTRQALSEDRCQSSPG